MAEPKIEKKPERVDATPCGCRDEEDFKDRGYKRG
jgi:hypothetical protein